MSKSFEKFMKDREAAARAYVAGNADPVIGLSTAGGGKRPSSIRA